MINSVLISSLLLKHVVFGRPRITGETSMEYIEADSALMCACFLCLPVEVEAEARSRLLVPDIDKDLYTNWAPLGQKK